MERKENYNETKNQLENAIVACMTTEPEMMQDGIKALKSLQQSGISSILLTRMLHMADGHEFKSDESKRLYTMAIKSLLEFRSI